MRLRSEIFPLLLAQLATIRAFSHTAEEYIAFEQICLDLLKATPAYRSQLKIHNYPDDPTGHRLIYCLGMITGNLNAELHSLNVDQIFGHFGDGLSPEQFRRKCEQCELRAKDATEDRFEQAFRIYKCFEKQYLKTFEPQTSTKVTCEQMKEAERICMEVFDVSPATRKLFRRQKYPESEESKRHTYCTALVAGLYTERDDLDMDRLASFLSREGESREAFVDRSRKCFKRMAAYEQGISGNEKMFRVYQCVAKEYEPFMMDC